MISWVRGALTALDANSTHLDLRNGHDFVPQSFQIIHAGWPYDLSIGEETMTAKTGSARMGSRNVMFEN